MRLASALAAVALAALAVAGCGSSPDGEPNTDRPAQTGAPQGAGAPVGAAARSCETGAVAAEGLRATGISCERARQVMLGWQRQGSCAAPAGASRVSCSSRSYRCIGARTDRGTAVSCSRPGRSVAFVVKP